MSGMNKAERLEEMKRLYIQRAYSDIEMAERLGVDRTLIYRDRMELTGEYPIEKDDEGRYHIQRTKLISEIKVNLHEALTLYLAARKTSRQTRFHHPHAANAVEKLAATLRQPMTEKLLKAADAVLKQEKDPERIKIIEILAQAWVEQRKVRVRYQPFGMDEFRNHVIHPYLIEPSIWSDSVYVIAYSEVTERITPFKVDRIDSAFLSGETFETPETFDDQQLLKHAWGIWVGNREPIIVKLRFNRDAARRVKESIWHPLESVTDTDDGGCIWSAEVAEWREMLPWVRGWGADCEVLEPEKLKSNMKREAQKLMQLYMTMGDLPVKSNTSIENRVLLLWGKTQKGSIDPDEYHPVLFHMLDIAFIARILLGNDASPRWKKSLGRALGADPNTIREWLPWFIALHDIGKISAPFQYQNEIQRERLIKNGFEFGSFKWKNKPSHAEISELFTLHDLEKELPENLHKALQDLTGGHHGFFSSSSQVRENKARLQKEPNLWTELRKQSAGLLAGLLLKSPSLTLPNPENISTAIMTLTGFTILCDWIGSNNEIFIPSPNISLEDYLNQIEEKAMRAVQAAGFMQTSASSAPSQFDSLFPGMPARPVQSAIDDLPDEMFTEPCIAIIEAPTGEGKTEAALALAHRMAKTNGTDELYYALPTTATSNQMFGRIQKYMVKNLGLESRIKLVHGQAWLYEDDLRLEFLTNGKGNEYKQAQDWFASKKRALLAPFGVGTIDQAELAVLNVKHVPLRMMGLAGKVLIVDEVHAYDTYMTAIIYRLLEWLSAIGTSVILLSATLPKKRRSELLKAYNAKSLPAEEREDAYPSIWIANSSKAYLSTPPAQQAERKIMLNTNTLHFGDDEAAQKAEWLVKQVENGGCSCWMTNTVRRAQEIFSVVRQIAPKEVDCSLLHAQFPLDQRHQIEGEISEKYGPGNDKRPKRGIVIGTQVLEQSLDLDFDVMASDLAPVDLLLQRAGRLHRHARIRHDAHKTPCLWINTEQSPEGLDVGVNKFVYDEYILRTTWDVIKDQTEWALPIQYRSLIEAVYDSAPSHENKLSQKAWNSLQEKETQAEQIANLYMLPEPNPDDAFSGTAASKLQFIESETQSGWIVAQTRLGEQSITVIPLERSENSACAIVDGREVTVPLDEEPSRAIQVQLMRKSVRVSNQTAVEALKNAKGLTWPTEFNDPAILRDYLPLWLDSGKAILKTNNRQVVFELEPELGLLVRTQKGG